MRLDYFSDLFQVEAAGFCQTTSYDNPLWAEYVDESGNTSSQVVEVIVHALHRQRKTFMIEPYNQFAVYFLVETQVPFLHRCTEPSDQGGSGGVMLQATGCPAGTTFAVGNQRDMSHFRAPVGVAVEQFAVNDDSSASSKSGQRASV